MATDVDALIQSAQERANSLSGAAAGAASAVGYVQPSRGNAYDIGVPTLRGAPPIYTGGGDITSDLQRIFAAAFGDFKPEMLEGLDDFIARFFPACVFANTEDWICNTILYGGTGIPPDVEAQIYSRARSRDTQEARKMRAVAVKQFANRGFSLPAGVLTARLQEVEQEASIASGKTSSEIAIKQAEIQIETIKFAVAEGVKIRGQVINAIADYIKAYMLPIDLANSRADLVAKSKGQFLNSAADYYRAMVAEAELQLKAGEINSSSYTAVEVAYSNAVASATPANARVAAGIAESLISAAGQAAAGVLGVGQAIETSIINA